MAQNLQGLSYEVDSTNIVTTFQTRIIQTSFWDMHHTRFWDMLVVMLRGFMRFVYMVVPSVDQRCFLFNQNPVVLLS